MKLKELNELMSTKRPWTADEMAVMEAELLKMARQAHAENMRIVREVYGKEPELAQRLESSSRRMLDNIELAIESERKN